MHPLVHLLLALLPSAGDGLTGLDQDMLEVLTDSTRADALVFHYAPGSIAPEVLAEDVRANVAAFHELEELLGMQFGGPVDVFLYEDVEDIEERTGAGTYAFSVGERSVHQVRDFRGTHELVHLFATQFAWPPDGFADGFVVEGLATGVTEFESGAPLHAWCAAYAKFGRLPALWDLRGTFPEGVEDGVHPYHIAGSFVRFAIERFGIERVKRWYVEALEAKATLGESFVGLEREWLAMLQALEVDPEYEDLVRARLGLPRASPGEWDERPRFDGATLGGWTAEESDAWSVGEGLLVGRHEGPWTVTWSDPVAGLAGVRARFRLVEGDAFKIELAPTSREGAEGSEDAERSEAIFTWQAVFLAAGDDYSQVEGTRVVPGFWNEAVLLRTGGREKLYLNEVLLLDAQRGAGLDEARIGLGVENGRVEVALVSALGP